ncbi:MAG: pyrroline-5-carboxylate reductase [Candidatus Faecousia sp.]|uniref:pyrroline-5-carboxylate reductase n=1 Tax=Faecousia sp. TaxID=2952921 RepID=UPI002A8BF015|nr:pyrroline-5-carboxylate reductase [Candidatus Faecousia sp.]
MIGFIGVGNMGGALAECACKSVGAWQIAVSSRTREHAEAVAARLDCRASENAALAAQARLLFLGVKPHQLAGALRPLQEILKRRSDRFALVSMAAGVTTERIALYAGGSYPVIRLMPNTPAQVGAGMVPFCTNAAANAEDVDALKAALASAGRVEPLPEAQMDAISALSGCGPAFVYLMLEALADAGVACGLPRGLAQEAAAQTALGAAQMVLQTGKHPAALKDAVCSPGGSTIAGVLALERGGFRAAAEQAVLAAFEKTKKLGNL